jgi:hypothetical protein
MQQMSGLMEHMAAQIKASPLPPDETLQLSMMMKQMAGMLTKRGSGTLDSDTATQLEGIRARLTEIRKGPAALLGVPPLRNRRLRAGLHGGARRVHRYPLNVSCYKR